MLGLRLDPNVLDTAGHSPLWHALAVGSADCARALLKAGVPIPDIGDGVLIRFPGRIRICMPSCFVFNFPLLLCRRCCSCNVGSCSRTTTNNHSVCPSTCSCCWSPSSATFACSRPVYRWIFSRACVSWWTLSTVHDDGKTDGASSTSHGSGSRHGDAKSTSCPTTNFSCPPETNGTSC
jgi:ankyrin repeat protein